MKQLVAAVSMILIGLAWMQPAKAALLLEPYAGWAISGNAEFDVTDPSGIDDQGDLTGPGFGVRLGYATTNFSVGVDYSILNVEPDFNQTEDSNLDTQNMGVFVGYTFPIELRLWAGYLIQTKADFGADELTGTGVKVGAGWMALPWLGVNFEYYMQDWEEVNGTSLGQAAQYSEFDSDMFLLSVSVPLDL